MNTDRRADRQASGQTCGQTGGRTDRRSDGQVDRQADGQTGGRTDRWADKVIQVMSCGEHGGGEKFAGATWKVLYSSNGNVLRGVPLSLGDLGKECWASIVIDRPLGTWGVDEWILSIWWVLMVLAAHGGQRGMRNPMVEA